MLKGKISPFFLSFLISILCFGILISGTFFHIKNSFSTAQNPVEYVPYEPMPQNVGIMVNISNDKTLLYLDFESSSLKLLYADDWTEEKIYNSGYSLDFFIEGNFDLIKEIVDYLGGVDMVYNGEKLCCTGNQVIEILSFSSNFDNDRRNLTEGILNEISKQSVKLNLFLKIIENCKTDLTVPDCYLWCDYISILCENVIVIN